MSKLKKLIAALLVVMMAVVSLPIGTAFAAAPDHIVINQIYGGGGKDDTPFTHSFIELYNPTDSEISLSDYRITYSSNRDVSKKDHAGSTMQQDGTIEVVELALSGSIPAKHSFLIRCAAEQTEEAVYSLTNADMDWDRVIDNDQSVEIILYHGEERIDAVSTRVDGFQNVGEGDAPATTDISKQKSLRRTNFSDTDNNAIDFSLLVWNELSDADKQAFIDANRPRSLADGEWTENRNPEEEQPSEPETPTQDFTLKNDGFENETAIALDKIGAYVTGISNKDGGVAEIVSYDAENNNAWVVNGTTGMLDIISLANVTCAVSDEMTAESLDIKALVAAVAPDFAYGDMTSVAIHSQLGIAAVALQDAAYDQNGYVAILSTDGELLAMIPAGVQPDMLCFTPDGTKILVANEGEPREGVGSNVTDPAGSVTVIAVNAENISESQSQTIGFENFDSSREALVADGIMFRKDALPSVDFEPEYIASTNDTAYVALQEANAIAVLNLNTNTFTGVYSLGYKDLSLEENAIDLVEDGQYIPKTYENAVGAYMPDGIALYTVNGETYILTANEGDAREWGSGDTEYVNEIKETLTAADGTQAEKVRVIDPEVTDGLPEGKNVLYGGRSFSIYKVEEDGLTQIYDSGSDFEEKTAAYLPGYFNCSNDDNDYDSRSAKKGPEPESVIVGTVDGKTYAFVALERTGGIMMYDITDPENVLYTNYINTRDFAENPDQADPDNAASALTSDIAPEGLYFISSQNSPSGTPILLSAFEVSGTVAAYSVESAPQGHNFSEEWTSDGENHWHVCLICGAEANKAQHAGGTATCKNQAVCEVCGASYGELNSENHSGAVNTVNAKEATCTEEGYTGDKVCADCGTVIESGMKIEKVAHNYENGVCTICGTNETDNPNGNPQTGDSFNIMLWVALIGISGAGAYGILYMNRKQRREDNEYQNSSR